MSQMLPITQCRRCHCDASITLIIQGGGAGSALFGRYNPNDEGLIPTNPLVVNYFEQQTDDGYFFTQWKWNPDYQFWA